MSLFNKTWIFPKTAPAEFFELNKRFSKPFKQILWNRNFRDKKEIQPFLDINYETGLNDPYLLKSIKKASLRILKSIKNNENIVIYGDYDADGVCGTTLLRQTLIKLGAKYIDFYIPDRANEGYGLNMNAIKKFIEDKVQLIITVDCGSGNIKEIEYAKKNDIDVIVTDHHQVLTSKTSAYALINPHQRGDKYPFKHICGTAVVFKLAQVLLNEARKLEWPAIHSLGEGWVKWLLDLVAIATVTDVMPLLNENRVFVKYGMLVLAQTKRKGLRELMKKANMSFTFDAKTKTTNLSSYALGFMVGPRLNAAGRMEHANLAFELLNAENLHEAQRLASDLEKKNKERQILVLDILSEIEPHQVEESSVIFIGQEHWPIGVLGIVAGRLSDKYQKPAFVYQRREDFLVGSARSPEIFNIVDIMRGASGLLEKFGGHKQAGGFTASLTNEIKLEKAIIKHTKKVFENLNKQEVSGIEIDAEVNFNDVTEDFYNELFKMEPFGEANSKPVLYLKNVYLNNVRAVGNNFQHFKCNIAQTPETISPMLSAIGFGVANNASHIKDGHFVDILFNLDMDEWNGYKNLVLKLIDICSH